MNLMMSPLPANASGSLCGNGKSGSRTDQFGKLEFQPVPAFAAPAFGDPLALQHEVRKPALLQPVAHHEPGLAAADHERLDLFIRHVAGPCGVWRALPPRG